MEIILSNTPPAGWDERLGLAASEAGLCQSTYWARVIDKIGPSTPLFVEVRSSKNDVVASLLLLHKVAGDGSATKDRTPFGRIISGPPFAWLDSHDGPVIHTKDPNEAREAINHLLQFVDRVAKKQKVAAIQSHGLARTSLWASDKSVADIFAASGYSVGQWATYLVDLTREENTLWAGISHASRKSIKKASRMGVTVTKMACFEEYMERYHLSYCSFEADAGRPANSSESIARICWDEDRSGYYGYYVAQSADGEVLGTLGMYLFNGIATEIASSLGPRAFREKIPAQDVLHWEMFLEAKRAGCHTFDLAGINPEPKSPKEEGIRRFKEKWGGRYVLYNHFEKANSSMISLVRGSLGRVYGRLKKSLNGNPS